MYAPLSINGVELRAMVDTEATHLFISEVVARRLELKISRTADAVQMANATEQRMVGVAYDVPVVLGGWSGRHHARVISLNEYEAIIGIELLRRAKAVVFPHLDGIQILHDQGSCWVPALESLTKARV